jgi:hypothetical protein
VFETAAIARPFTKSKRKPARKKKPTAILQIIGNLLAQRIIPQIPVRTAVIAPAKIETLNAFCEAPAENQGFIVRKIRDVIDEVDTTIGGYVTKLMCSSQCPCTSNSNQTQWTNLDKNTLDSFNRTLAWKFDGTNSTSYNTFIDCWDAVIAGNSTIVNKTDVDQY